MMLYAKAQNPTSMSVANGMSHAVSTRRNATTNPVRPATTSPNCTFARRREWRVAPDQTGTNCVIAPMIVIQIHPANRRWRWASRPSPGTAFRCKPIPTPIPATRKASPTTKCRNGTVIGGCWSVSMFPGIAPIGLGTVSAHLTVPPKMLPSAGWTFLTRAKGTSHRPTRVDTATDPNGLDTTLDPEHVRRYRHLSRRTITSDGRLPAL